MTRILHHLLNFLNWSPLDKTFRKQTVEANFRDDEENFEQAKNP